VTASSLGSLLDDVKKELAASDYSIDIQEVPALPDIYLHFTQETIGDPFEPIALPARDAFVDETILCIHSSGSTGFPKPISWTHEILSNWTFGPLVDDFRGLDKDIRESSLLAIVFDLTNDISHGNTGLAKLPRNGCSLPTSASYLYRPSIGYVQAHVSSSTAGYFT
jgi:hypothetical protein